MKTVRRILFFFLALVVCTTPCLAFSSGENITDYAGQWAMKLGGRTFMVITIQAEKGKVGGTVRRPLHYQILGANILEITPASTLETIPEGAVKQGKLAFLARNPSSGNEESFEMALKSRSQAELRKIFQGKILDPWMFARIPLGQHPAVANDWEQRHVYYLDDAETSNPEMKKIFDGDQQDRSEDFSLTDWDRVTPRDQQRRAATRKLLEEDQLHTGEDFREAAFVFQHGDKPEDYLLAHTLAMIAASRGDGLGLWIAAATLDRYLQSVQKPQIYGTQVVGDGKKLTQDPYDRELISDALRRKLAVPSLADQQENLKKTPQ
ncbi:MAG TPA: hypothetical protein VH024_13060 [Candidatus Angelobacter sp.]|nr:hypothetical protein [Candidatus Angelobacter sp.]